MKPANPIFLPDVTNRTSDPTCGLLLGVLQDTGARGNVWLRIVGPIGTTLGSIAVNHGDLEAAVQKLYESLEEPNA